MQEHPEDLVHTLRLHYGPETTKKSGNPFHMIHLDEMKFAGILKENFGRVDRIDDCGTPNKYITPYNSKRG